MALKYNRQGSINDENFLYLAKQLNSSGNSVSSSIDDEKDVITGISETLSTINAQLESIYEALKSGNDSTVAEMSDIVAAINNLAGENTEDTEG